MCGGKTHNIRTSEARQGSPELKGILSYVERPVLNKAKQHNPTIQQKENKKQKISISLNMILRSLSWIDILHLWIYWKGLYFIGWSFLSTKFLNCWFYREESFSELKVLGPRAWCLLQRSSSPIPLLQRNQDTQEA